MFNQQLQQQQQLQQLQQQQLQQQQQLLQLHQLLQQSPPQASLPMPVSRGLPQQPSQQQLLNLQGTHSASLLNGSVLQRALLLQQLQGLDQFAMPPATYDSAGLTMPTAALGNLRAYNMTAPSLAAPSLTPPQMVTPNLQQFFPQATRQSLLGPPPVGVPMNPSQFNHSGRNSQKQARTSSSSTPNCKTVPLGDREDPTEGSEEASELQMDTPEDQDLLVCPDGMVSEIPVPEPFEASEPAAKRSKSSEESTEKGPAGQPQAKVQPQTQMRALKETQTPDRLPEPPGVQVLPHCQPQVLQIQAQVQPRLQKQTQTSPEHLAPRQNQVQPQVHSQPPWQVQPQETDPQKQAQTQTQTQTHPQVSAQAQPQEQLPGQRQEQTFEKTQDQPQTWPQGSAPQPEQASVLACATEPRPSSDAAEAGGGPEEALPEPVGAQSSEDTSQEASAVGLDVGECERRAGELLGMWGAGGSLKVTILQSSDSRAFNTTPLTSGPRPGDSTAAPALASTSSKQTLQFFCYICKTNCSSQQEFQDHMSEAQHQQRLGEMQHSRQTCLLSLLPMPRDILEREAEEPPPKRWCSTCQVYYVGDLIQHRRTQEHKIAKQSLRPFCTICNRYFKTPRKFVEHVKSQGHKDKAKELKTLEKEIASPEEDHFITVDAVGCFESDQDEDEDDEEEEEIEAEEEFCQQVRSRDPSLEEQKGSETYNPNTAYGVDFLVPVRGYVCRICHKFYDSDSGLQLSHCRSRAHFENLQKYKAAKKPSPASRPVSRKCAINARNALTALFTSNSGSGRPLSQPSPQDMARLPSKVKPGSPNPPPPLRRSTRLKT
ncbi:cip1-interacting zinc finger protein isoform X2 [Onychomys torridus]|uniref:cip1-interacting zinc finger protein isoform X2 n=1 Tax=Onychomys torridus TaxID=38674 RepID=UPI00167F7498|nr:cip1-interacting zinc finger protein isoform X2 [Onychomys torridus]